MPYSYVIDLAAGIAICFAQMAALPADAWLRLVAWMLLGLLIYFIYGKKHSRIRQPQPANASSL